MLSNRIMALSQPQQPTFEGKKLPKSVKKDFQLNEIVELVTKARAFSMIEGDTVKYIKKEAIRDKQIFQEIMINDLFTRLVNKFIVKDTIKFLDKNIGKK